MIGHDHIRIKCVFSLGIMLQRCDHQASPSFVSKEWLSAFGLSGDEVGVFIQPDFFTPGTNPFPSGAKAPPHVVPQKYGLKPVPFTSTQSLPNNCAAPNSLAAAPQKAAGPRPRCGGLVVLPGAGFI